MRNYWLRIAIGALAIFTVGMIGVTLARRGVGHVRGVVEGSGPIMFPLAFVPFKLDGQKLGTVNRVILHREAPKHISGVELEIKLNDSVLARGLEGCRLAADLDAEHKRRGDRFGVGPLSRGVFFCLQDRDSMMPLQEFGHAVFQPGDVSVPLLLPNDIVDDLKREGYESQHHDSVQAAAHVTADSIAQEAEARADSISAIAELQAESVIERSERLVDSLRREGIRRADSIRRPRMADSAPRR